jgi:hypothetical protein
MAVEELRRVVSIHRRYGEPAERQAPAVHPFWQTPWQTPS